MVIIWAVPRLASWAKPEPCLRASMSQDTMFIACQWYSCQLPHLIFRGHERQLLGCVSGSVCVHSDVSFDLQAFTVGFISINGVHVQHVCPCSAHAQRSRLSPLHLCVSCRIQSSQTFVLNCSSNHPHQCLYVQVGTSDGLMCRYILIIV